MVSQPKFKRNGARCIGAIAAVILAFSGSVTNIASSQSMFRNFATRELGNDHGLTDLKGKELLPPIYAGIRYLGHGLYLLKQRCPEPEKRFDCLKEKLLLGSNMRRLSVKVPKGATFERVLWLGKSADENPDLKIEKLPNDALIVFEEKDHFGVCDSKGNAIIPADCTWVGNYHEGVVALRTTNQTLHSFRFDSNKMQKLAYQQVRKDCHLRFSEGLAPFATQPTPPNKSLWGYMDIDGNVVIEPKFVFAHDFEQGLACVRFPAAGGAPAHNELIDKTGKLASPPNMTVVIDFGSYLEVIDSEGKRGVVNRKFEYVIKPLYKSLSAQALAIESVDDFDVLNAPTVTPMYYFATRADNGKIDILSAKGDVVLPDADRFMKKGWRFPPIYDSGAFIFNTGPGVPRDKGTVVNLKGEVITAPFSDLSSSKDISFRQIAPGILLKTIQCNKEVEEMWSPTPILPKANLKQAGLTDYVCSELKQAADDFKAGHYKEVIDMLKTGKFDERVVPVYQPVFLRGLCLQSLGKFDEASAEYAAILGNSSDKQLKEKAQIGTEACKKKRAEIPTEMLRFSSR